MCLFVCSSSYSQIVWFLPWVSPTKKEKGALSVSLSWVSSISSGLGQLPWLRPIRLNLDVEISQVVTNPRSTKRKTFIIVSMRLDINCNPIRLFSFQKQSRTPHDSGGRGQNVTFYSKPSVIWLWPILSIPTMPLYLFSFPDTGVKQANRPHTSCLYSFPFLDCLPRIPAFYLSIRETALGHQSNLTCSY